MPTQHANITEANLHESKGASTAAIDTVAIATGAGSATWAKIGPKTLSGVSSNGTAGQIVHVDGAGGWTLGFTDHGSISFVNIGTPYVLTYPAAFTKLVPTTTASGHSVEVTEATTARLTYTGSHTENFDCIVTISTSQGSGAARDLSFAVAKNGTVIAATEQILSTSSGDKRAITLFADLSLTTNDYVEVFAKNNGASGDISVYAFQMFIGVL